MSDLDASSPAHRGASVDDVKQAVREAMQQLAAHEKDEKAEEHAKAQKKERLTNRVSIAAICLTMLMSFLNFARAEREGASASAHGDAARAKSDAEANWAYYQTRLTERSGFVVADDALRRETSTLADSDPRVRFAAVQHADYVSHVATIDREMRQVAFVAQELERRRILREREAQRIGLKIGQYDTGTRVLTLAVVLLSVTLLANRAALFWVSVGIAFVGAAIAVNGYFLFV